VTKCNALTLKLNQGVNLGKKHGKAVAAALTGCRNALVDSEDFCMKLIKKGRLLAAHAA
jgi:hypothetical protein